MSAPDATRTDGSQAGARTARVPFSARRLVVIAQTTFLEAVRQKLFSFLVLMAVGFVASAQLFREFNFGSSELKFIADFGFGSLVFFGSALTIAATAQLFFSEIENRTALTLLAKPVWRSEFIFGKLLGVVAVMGVFCLLMTGLLCALLFQRETQIMETHPESFEGGRLVDYSGVVVVGALQWLKFAVLAAITLFIASFSNTHLYTVIMSFFVLVICHLQYLARDAYERLGSMPLQALTRLLGLAFPNFQLFNVADLVGTPAGLPWQVAARIGAYALVYVGVIGWLAVWSFRSREI